MFPRFFHESSLIEAEVAELADDEAHHLINVLRMKRGDRATLFDGSGWEFEATVTEIKRQRVGLQIDRRAQVDRENRRQLHLAISLPKGDRQKWLVEKLTEMGVQQLTPLVTERSVAQPTDSAVQRLRRHVIGACKQSGRNRLMEIAPPAAYAEWLQRKADGAARLVAHPGVAGDLASLIRGDARPLLTIIGPEGGLTDSELEFAERTGWTPAGLGPRILRIETAALAVAAVAAAP